MRRAPQRPVLQMAPFRGVLMPTRIQSQATSSSSMKVCGSLPATSGNSSLWLPMATALAVCLITAIPSERACSRMALRTGCQSSVGSIGIPKNHMTSLIAYRNLPTAASTVLS